ncbi:MAG TPA: hypothetical protein VME41_02415 [Stellaceae bacterium]|nr:hypothetical protein [Stellaceae bacterium]
MRSHAKVRASAVGEAAGAVGRKQTVFVVGNLYNAHRSIMVNSRLKMLNLVSRERLEDNLQRRKFLHTSPPRSIATI